MLFLLLGGPLIALIWLSFASDASVRWKTGAVGVYVLSLVFRFAGLRVVGDILAVLLLVAVAVYLEISESRQVDLQQRWKLSSLSWWQAVLILIALPGIPALILCLLLLFA